MIVDETAQGRKLRRCADGGFPARGRFRFINVADPFSSGSHPVPCLGRAAVP